MIQTVSNLIMKGGKVLTRNTIIHRRQGDMDGACAVYSVMMCLLRLGYVNKSDLEVYNLADKRKRKGKLLYELLENNGLIKSGFGFIELKKEIERLTNGDIKISRKAPRNQDKNVQLITDLIDKDIAPIISVDWAFEGAHALFAIGYESDADGIITKILCLDPGAVTPEVSSWNCYLEVQNTDGEYPIKHVAINQNPARCKLSDMLILELSN